VYHAELAKDECARKGVRTIANEFDIPNQYRTIANRAKGHRSAAEFGEECQKVTAVEVILVNFILESVDWGFPITHTQNLRTMLINSTESARPRIPSCWQKLVQ